MLAAMDLRILEFVYLNLVIAVVVTSTTLMSLLDKKTEDIYIIQECKICPPGYGASYHCAIAARKKFLNYTKEINQILETGCVKCDQGWFSSNYSQVEVCQPCRQCNLYLERTIQACSGVRDTICSLRTTKIITLKSHGTKPLTGFFTSQYKETKAPQLQNKLLVMATIPFKLNSVAQSKSSITIIPNTLVMMITVLFASMLILFCLWCFYVRRKRSRQMQQLEISAISPRQATPDGINSYDIRKFKKEFDLNTSPMECEGNDYAVFASTPLMQKSGNDVQIFQFQSSFRRKDINIFGAPPIEQPKICLYFEDKTNGYEFIDTRKVNLSTVPNESMSVSTGDEYNELIESIPVIPEKECPDDYQMITSPQYSSSLESFEKNEDDCDDDNDCGIVEMYPDPDGPLMKVSKVIGSAGGVISSKYSSCRVIVPEGALPPDVNEEIFFKLYVDRPNDWEKLKMEGQNIDLPIIDLGPSGIQFLKPVEVHINNNLGDNIEDVEFQYCEGEYNVDSKWLNAVRANTREEGIAKAQNVEPHVSYVVENDETIAYYLHFTGGRRKVQCKSKLVEATVYINRSTRMEDCAGLAVYLYDPKEEITQKMKGMLHQTSVEVALHRKNLILFRDKEDITIKIRNTEGGWILQGNEVETITIAHFFDPELIGSLPCQDYLFKLDDVTNTSLSCEFVIQQLGQTDPNIFIDLKVPLGRGFMNTYRYASSGYYSIAADGFADLPVFEETVLSDEEYKHEEPRTYMENLCSDLSEFIAPRYKQIARNLRVRETALERTENDLRSRGESCREICYQILLGWLRGHSFVNNPECKQMLLDLLEKAVHKAGCTFIAFPAPSTQNMRLRTQSKLETSV